MDNYELANRIYNCISDGYDDEEYREETVNALCDELSQSENEYIKLAFIELCKIIEEN